MKYIAHISLPMVKSYKSKSIEGPLAVGTCIRVEDTENSNGVVYALEWYFGHLWMRRLMKNEEL